MTDFDEGIVRNGDVVSVGCYSSHYVATSTFKIVPSKEEGKVDICRVEGVVLRVLGTAYPDDDSVMEILQEQGLLRYLTSSKLITSGKVISK